MGERVNQEVYGGSGKNCFCERLLLPETQIDVFNVCEMAAGDESQLDGPVAFLAGKD